MTQPDFISTLPQPEQKALAVCGIYQAQQLSRLHIRTFLAEMAQAAELFPDTFHGITEQRLKNIYLQAMTICAQQSHPDEEEDVLPEPEDPTRPLPQLVEKPRVTVRKISQEAPQAEGKISLSRMSQESAGSGRSKTIHNSRPFRTYFSSLVCMWLILSCFYLLYTAIKATLQFEIPGKLELILPMASLVVSFFFYVVYATKTTCPVCNMKLYSIHRYSRNRKAHHLPFFGYSGATALHILFLFWFRCPACGTPQRLNKRKS